MTASAEPVERRRRRPSRALLIVGPVLVLAVLLVWATGGLRPAPATGVRTLPAGTELQLKRWRIAVQKVELANTSDYGTKQPSTLRVWLSMTWTGTQSTYGPSDGLLALVVPGGPEPATDPLTVDVQGRSGGFDPDVPRPLVLDYTWPALRNPSDDRSQPPAPGVPARVQVVVRDEYQAQNFLFDDDWRTTGPIGFVALPVRDVRR